MSFSAEWLALREPIDHAARNSHVLDAVKNLLIDKPRPRLTDIGSGTGSTLRALRRVLPSPLHWHLVDYDPTLLAIAKAEAGDDLVCLTTADLSQSLAALTMCACDLVTTSAFLDLVSAEWLRLLVATLAAHRLPFYAALSYDGRAGCLPRHPDDERVLSAFNAHQKTDKGFGPALGPDVANMAINLFEKAGFRVVYGLSDWQAGPDDSAFQRMLFDGWRQAARHMRPDCQTEFDNWFDARQAFINARDKRACAFVGHIDFLALPLHSGEKSADLK